ERVLGGKDDPWWHLWEMNIDGTGLKQLTFGPYHDVNPIYLPDGRIMFSSTRIGMRDEYHGFPCTGLTVCNADGSDIHCIGFNLGGDREPATLDDGRIVFSRLDLFYSRLKTEFTVQAVFPDGTKNVTLYGPERRDFWHQVTRESKVNGWSESPPRHRPLRLTQPQPFDDGRIVCATQGGLTLIGPGRNRETIIAHDKKMAVTCPYPLGDGNILCSASIKQFEIDGRVYTATSDAYRKHKGTFHLSKAINVDLGLYILDAATGGLKLLYNDPDWAEFDARPVRARQRPAVLAEGLDTRSNSYTAQFFCNSVRTSRQSRVATRGKFVRVVEGMPVVSRHKTQQNPPGILWRNHGGVHARVLGTAPLGADGSFHVEVPADRLIHMQVLDSDRRVVGNQLIWMYARPGEKRSCVGCHEKPDTNHLPFTYRAKAWLKGTLPDETEERARVVRAINLIGRH
ncbi:MAG: HzsA-related protein, partial [Planctomycetota bacterium]